MRVELSYPLNDELRLLRVALDAVRRRGRDVQNAAAAQVRRYHRVTVVADFVARHRRRQRAVSAGRRRTENVFREEDAFVAVVDMLKRDRMAVRCCRRRRMAAESEAAVDDV